MAKFGDARDSNTFNGSRSTMPPRMRDGQTIAGGRRMRKAQGKLSVLLNNFVDKMPNAKSTQCTKPGSMNR